MGLANAFGVFIGLANALAFSSG